MSENKLPQWHVASGRRDAKGNLRTDGLLMLLDQDGRHAATLYGEAGRHGESVAAWSEMLNLLKDMLEAHDTGETIIGWESARALIAKAEGSSND
jgi:hypothetical protein